MGRLRCVSRRWWALPSEVWRIPHARHNPLDEYILGHSRWGRLPTIRNRRLRGRLSGGDARSGFRPGERTSLRVESFGLSSPGRFNLCVVFAGRRGLYERRFRILHPRFCGDAMRFETFVATCVAFSMACQDSADQDPEQRACIGLNVSTLASLPTSAASTCATSIAGDHLYSDCVEDVLPAGCLIKGGTHHCLAGSLTAVCYNDSDCPGGSRCLSGAGVGTVPPSIEWGYCAQTCASDLDCGRCDMFCQATLSVCRRRSHNDESDERE